MSDIPWDKYFCAVKKLGKDMVHKEGSIFSALTRRNTRVLLQLTVSINYNGMRIELIQKVLVR